jgi:hypothetical protein
MLHNQYVANVLSDFITLTITVIVGVAIYRLTERRRLQSFLLSSKNGRVVIYLSNLTIDIGKALDSVGEPRTYQGGAIPTYEALFIPIFYRLFNAPIPGLETQPR